jgi:hypothetical protein
MLLSTTIHAESLIEALAHLKDIPVSKVVRNASRDFAQAALKATPVAKVSKSEFYYFWRNGVKHFLHQSQVGKRKRNSKLRKVRVHRGWSKASWLGVFRALGVSLRMPTNRLPQAVEHLSNAIQSGSQQQAKCVLTDQIHFDGFNGGQDRHSQGIARAGFELAAKRITGEVNKMLVKQWGGR